VARYCGSAAFPAALHAGLISGLPSAAAGALVPESAQGPTIAAGGGRHGGTVGVRCQNKADASRLPPNIGGAHGRPEKLTVMLDPELRDSLNGQRRKAARSAI
jgi:hypothetical protein